MRLAKPNCPEKKLRGEEIVHIVNSGPRDIRVPWQTPIEGTPQQYLRISSGCEKPVPQYVAWAILGDMDLRPGEDHKPMKGNKRDWDLQVNRLQNFHGYEVATKWKGETPMQAAVRVRSEAPDDPGDFEQLPMPNDQERYNTFIDPLSMWKYILDGHLYCKEWVKKFGKGKALYSHVKPVITAAEIADIGGQEVPIGAGGKRDGVGGEERRIK